MAEYFQLAKPVWQQGKTLEMNWFVAFSAKAPAGEGVLRVTGSMAYAVYVNGQFLAYGPARACKNYFRVDNLSLTLEQPENIIAIEVAGYNTNNFEYAEAPSFVQAEIEVDGKLVAATGDHGFVATHLTYRHQKTQRYSFQRPFTEYLSLAPHSFDHRIALPQDGVAQEIVEDKQLLPRRVNYLTYPRADVIERVAQGRVVPTTPEKYWEDRALLNIGPKLKGFKKDELCCITSKEVQELRADFTDRETVPFTPQKLESDTAAIYRFAHNTAGLLGLTVECLAPATVYLVFDELLVDGDIQFWRTSSTCVVKYDLLPGRYDLLSFEPYVAHFVKVMVMGGACKVDALYIRQVVNPCALDIPKTDNKKLAKVYEAAAETFRQNAPDLFMDCPSRERAGWLCDSFFTSRVEKRLTGGSLVEKNFLENFLLPDHFDFIPEGVFPMCYPSDHNDGVFIPNWTMWLVLELEEYLQRSGDREMIDAFRDKVYGLIKYFDRFNNEDGLLEHLESWVFLEWSKSNELVQDVNYPSNMLWARTLEAVASMYGDQSLADRAAAMKRTIREKALVNGIFFVDNAVRKDGKLVNGDIATESCQYYAFFTKTATPETDPALWQALITDFGPQRKETKAYPEIPFANAFIGNYLRLECLYREGLKEQVLQEIEGYFVFMAETTGTLWEHDRTVASCDHGFASHVVCWAE